MKKKRQKRQKRQKRLVLALCLLAAFAGWTILVALADLAPIGPNGSTVGLSTLNGLVRDLVGVRTELYVLTDWLGLAPILTALGFAVLGLAQWIVRRSLWKVDRSILVLGAFYAAVMAFYLLFEVVAVNYRPVLINGALEASYPSSTTLLVLCVMPTAAMQLRARLKNRMLGRTVVLAVLAFTVFTVLGRLLSGVHWITDIIGGMLLSAGLVMLYGTFDS